MNKIFKVLSIVTLLILSSCSKEKKVQDDKVLFTDNKVKKQEIQIHRFDKALFAANESKDAKQYLLSIEKEYAPMFATTLKDTMYLNIVNEFISDEQMRKAYQIIAAKYPNLESLEEELSIAVAKIKQIKKDTINPKIYTLIVGPAEYSQAFQNRILVYPEFSTISIDMYSVNELSQHPYYKTIPQYLYASLGKENIAPHYVNTYLKEITFRDTPLQSTNPEATLLDCIVEEGKYLYATQAVLPEKQFNYILDYTEEQLNWVEQNENNIWSYIIENQLLYNKDRTKFFHLISPGPSTKNIANSPSRIGNYIGYKIVQAYMKENPISLDSLFHNLDSKLILQQSKYKPKKS